jgi:hypothetical protein
MAAMKNSRATQPYRKGAARQSGLAMKAMQRGRTGTGGNPMDVQRAIAKGGDAPRTMHQPVKMSDAAAADAYKQQASTLRRESRLADRAQSVAAVGLARKTMRKPKAPAASPGSNANFHKAKGPAEINRTGNARNDQMFKTVPGRGGEWHVYENGRRVFVAKPKPKASINSPGLKGKARGPAKGVAR